MSAKVYVVTRCFSRSDGGLKPVLRERLVGFAPDMSPCDILVSRFANSSDIIAENPLPVEKYVEAAKKARVYMSVIHVEKEPLGLESDLDIPLCHLPADLKYLSFIVDIKNQPNSSIAVVQLVPVFAPQGVELESSSEPASPKNAELNTGSTSTIVKRKRGRPPSPKDTSPTSALATLQRQKKHQAIKSIRFVNKQRGIRADPGSEKRVQPKRSGVVKFTSLKETVLGNKSSVSPTSSPNKAGTSRSRASNPKAIKLSYTSACEKSKESPAILSDDKPRKPKKRAVKKFQKRKPATAVKAEPGIQKKKKLRRKKNTGWTRKSAVKKEPEVSHGNAAGISGVNIPGPLEVPSDPHQAGHSGWIESAVGAAPSTVLPAVTFEDDQDSKERLHAAIFGKNRAMQVEPSSSKSGEPSRLAQLLMDLVVEATDC